MEIVSHSMIQESFSWGYAGFGIALLTIDFILRLSRYAHRRGDGATRLAVRLVTVFLAAPLALMTFLTGILNLMEAFRMSNVFN